MSKGPGRIELAIRALFDAHPDLAYNLAPDGTWARQVALHVAERDGDAEVAAGLRAALDAEHAAWLNAFAKCFGATAARGNATLTALAERARGLAVENDPDAVRAGLATLAVALDDLAR